MEDSGVQHMKNEKIGEYAFLVGVVIAVLAGIASGAVVAYAGEIAAILVILGVIVGLLNVSDKEMTPFLVAAIALMIPGIAGGAAGIFSAIPTVGAYIDSILGLITVFVAPAAIIVALKAVYALGSGR